MDCRIIHRLLDLSIHYLKHVFIIWEGEMQEYSLVLN